ncbi:MAG TPA: NYN domain-containing protein [Clostridia bacterium]|nr:NYN domain-containing protein [Clostridia bacterium]
MQSPINPRVTFFIDHSNVCHRLIEMKKIDKNWVRWYNPEELAKELARGRQIIKINFYCAPPPSYLLQDGGIYERMYWKQMSYYEEIKKLPNVELKYARLSGVKGDLHEKNLDTQLGTDLIVQATSNQYDTVVLISNDGDYVSAVEAVKLLGRRVELVYFPQRLSWDLRKMCDMAIRARRKFFKELNFSVNANTP